jgi:ring-1,2-phenylacetyl-CoA epoxidase subunit PaaA
MTTSTIEAPEGLHYRCELEARGVEEYDEGNELPEEYRQLIVQVVMVQADLESELMFDSSLMQNHIMAAPDARSRMRMAKFFAEEINHGYTFWSIAKGLGVELTARYFKEAKRKRQEVFEHIGHVESWTELAVINTLTDRNGVFVFRDMEECSYRPWAKVSASVLRDEVGHTALGYNNLRELVLNQGQLAEAQRYLDKWYPMTLDMFGRSESTRQWRYIAWGIKRSPNEELRQQFVAEVNPLLEQLGLDPPDYTTNRHFL